MASSVIPGGKELNLSDYITLNSGYTLESGSKIIQIAPHILYLTMTINGSFAQGQTTIGTMRALPLSAVTIIAGSVSNPNASPIAPTVYPATAIFIPGGQIRVHSAAARSRAALAGFILY